MKQRLAPAAPRKTLPPVTTSAAWTVWQSPAGWTGLLETDAGLQRVLIGHASRDALLESIGGDATLCPGRSELCDRLDAYFAGQPDDFADVTVAALWNTPFQQAVIRALRKVGCGRTTTYAELAERAGRPGAARAVGQVMATNPVPIVVPCHRVLASNGKLGGFSAPTGLTLKQWLLDLESSSQRARKSR